MDIEFKPADFVMQAVYCSRCGIITDLCLSELHREWHEKNDTEKD